MSFAPLNLDAFVGRQIAEARKRQGLTQAELAQKLGFKDRQILSNLEKGLRKVNPAEITILMRELRQPLAYFTDPYQLPDKQLFSWRIATPAPETAAYERQGRQLLSGYMRISDLVGEDAYPILPQLGIGKDSTYDEVEKLAENLAGLWSLGPVPALRLAEVIRQQLKLELFFIESADAFAGASFRNDKLGVILINRQHPAGRQAFSMAHELFHILTWTLFPPGYVSPTEIEAATSRSEKLANRFAAGLLMPTGIILPLWNDRQEQALKLWLEKTAEHLQVSPDALFWRLVSLHKLKKEDKPADLNNPRQASPGQQPNLYSPNFVAMLHAALKQGKLSARKAATMLDCTIEDLARLFQSYRQPVPFSL